MIMFWNRYEVYCGTSVKKFNEILDILAANNIKYVYRIMGQGHIARGQMKYIYIHKKDAKRLPKI